MLLVEESTMRLELNVWLSNVIVWLDPEFDLSDDGKPALTTRGLMIADVFLFHDIR
jgi:hypothetical protein